MKKPALFILGISFLIFTFYVSRVFAGAPSGVLFLSYFDESTVNQRDGSSGSSSNISYTDGKYNKGVNFTSGVTLNYSSSGNINHTKGTVEIWVKPNWAGNDGQRHYFFVGNANSDSDAHSIQILKREGNFVYAQISGSTGVEGIPTTSSLTDTNGWSAGEWHHIAVSWDTEIPFLKLYIDGSLKETIDVDLEAVEMPSESRGNIYVGTFRDGSISADAVIDELIIFDSARSDGDISSHASSQPYPPSAETTTTASPTPTPLPAPQPPEISLFRFSPNPTKNSRPAITGQIKHTRRLESVEYSLDAGQSWFKASISFGSEQVGTLDFSILPFSPLEDGNYLIKVRAKDVLGKESISDGQLLIVDLLPPLVGGNTIYVGPQNLLPGADGTITTAVDIPTIFIVSAIGGPSKIDFSLGGEIYPFARIEGTNLWKGEIRFFDVGDYELRVNAVDGAGNVTERVLNKVNVLPKGIIKTRKGEIIPGAKVVLYVYSEVEQGWKIWEGGTFGQGNPYIAEEGKYSFLVPSGRYYLEASAQGFRKGVSEIFEVEETSVINSDLVLTQRPFLFFKIPFPSFLDIGEFVIAQPIEVSGQKQGDFQDKLLGQKIENFKTETVQGKEVDNSYFLGKKTLLTFVTTWNPAAQEQITILDTLGRGGFNVLPIFFMEGKGKVASFLTRGGYILDAGFDQNGASLSIFSVGTLPQHYLIDSTGVVSEVVVGTLTELELSKKLNNLP